MANPSIKTLSQDFEPCCICHEKIDDDRVVLGCKHEFHGECIGEWFKTSLTCCYCRRECRKLKYNFTKSGRCKEANFNKKTSLQLTLFFQDEGIVVFETKLDKKFTFLNIINISHAPVFVTDEEQFSFGLNPGQMRTLPSMDLKYRIFGEAEFKPFTQNRIIKLQMLPINYYKWKPSLFVIMKNLDNVSRNSPHGIFRRNKPIQVNFQTNIPNFVTLDGFGFPTDFIIEPH